ncbi:MAG TPA: cbb3-type cytochrome c oxidase subunit I [Acidimicrobiales bacterium]|nr:cbb3-type cytochrome c oxidase subunit I [Acidimicrobiales bacterium]
MTETRPDRASVIVEVPVPSPPPPAGLAGWLTTFDHKVVGRLFVVTSLLFLVLGSAAGAALGAERIDSGLQVLNETTFFQVYTLHGEVAVLLFLVPLFLGLATYLVPLQVGAATIAFPRGSATAYWVYLVSGLTLLGAYAADGGIGGDSRVGTDLYLLSLAMLALATSLALVSILTTAVALRAPGMTMVRTPLFTWSMLVGGGLTLLATPVLIARLIELYILNHFGGDLAAVDALGHVSWFWSLPQIYILAVPAMGVALEVVPVLSRARLRRHVSGIAVIGFSGILGFGAWAQIESTFDDLLYVLAGLVAVLPALALLGLLGDSVRRGSFVRKAPFLLALGAAVHLFLGALSGGISVIPGLELRDTAWSAAQIHFSLYGGATLAAFAALWYWAPKLWGVHLSDGAGTAVFALGFWGVLLMAGSDLVSGLSDQPLMATDFAGFDLATVLNSASAAGGLVSVLGVLLAVVSVLAAAAGRGTRAIADPWEANTLEWATTSPPPPNNFDSPMLAVASAAPLADEREGLRSSETEEATP